MLVQVAERRHHGQEDAEKQERHLPDRPEGEMILHVNKLRGESERGDRRTEHDQFAQEIGFGQEHRADDQQQEDQIDAALEPPRVGLLDLRLDGA